MSCWVWAIVAAMTGASVGTLTMAAVAAGRHVDDWGAGYRQGRRDESAELLALLRGGGNGGTA